jgi:hypothetical protein
MTALPPASISCAGVVARPLIAGCVPSGWLAGLTAHPIASAVTGVGARVTSIGTAHAGPGAPVTGIGTSIAGPGA